MSRIVAVFVAVAMTLPVYGQEEDLRRSRESGNPSTEPAEEIVVVGQRPITELRMQVMESERELYNLFNEFNDDRRFDVSCSTWQPTGTRLEEQICQPEFEIQATSAHARVYAQELMAFINPGSCGGCPVTQFQVANTPVAVEIARQQPEFQRRMQQAAKEHPEFLEALAKHTEARKQYEDATRTVREEK